MLDVGVQGANHERDLAHFKVLIQKHLSVFPRDGRQAEGQLFEPLLLNILKAVHFHVLKLVPEHFAQVLFFQFMMVNSVSHVDTELFDISNELMNLLGKVLESAVLLNGIRDKLLSPQ